MWLLWNIFLESGRKLSAYSNRSRLRSGRMEEAMNNLELRKYANEVRKGIVTAVHSAKVKTSAADKDPPGCPAFAL